MLPAFKVRMMELHIFNQNMERIGLEVLFWQPSGHRFYNERDILCVGGEEYYNLDMTNFVHGKDWIRCRDPIKESGVVEYSID